MSYIKKKGKKGHNTLSNIDVYRKYLCIPNTRRCASLNNPLCTTLINIFTTINLKFVDVKPNMAPSTANLSTVKLLIREKTLQKQGLHTSCA